MTSTAVRFVRAAVVIVLLALATPSWGAGTGGIEISPYPAVVKGKQLTAFRAELSRNGSARSVTYSLRNTTSSPKTARLYAASASRDGKGGFTIGEAGSSPYISFPAREVTLRGGASEIESFEVRGKLSGDAFGAVVVEVTNGAVTQRAATIVYLSPTGTLPVPLLLAIGAAVLIAAAGVALWLVRRRAT